MLIFFVVLLLFGAKKLPELARGMGKAIHEFKRASSDIQEDIKNSIEDSEKKERADVSEAEADKSAPREHTPEPEAATDENTSKKQ